MIIRVENIDMEISFKNGYIPEIGEFIIPQFYQYDSDNDTDCLIGFKNPVAAMRAIFSAFIENADKDKPFLVEGKGKRIEIYMRMLKRLSIAFVIREEDDLFFKSVLINF